ncbi:cardiolipin synthase [Chitinophaga skermanii]|uniref:Cardiolipin synthase n=1 Tax=Chitinophaga skermanii TaxID=331697 RepID=A0A327R4U8_9BACT|nr:cardiolipin synthase [Chitinophaga skermanii]RAJ08917.1 cardiolipin synthase [Chitinophaga skermanii]
MQFLHEAWQFFLAHWESIGISVVYLITFGVALKALLETRSTGKAMAYLLLLFFLPGVGIIIYLTVGVNPRINKIYSKKWAGNLRLSARVQEYLRQESREALLENAELIGNKSSIARMLFRDILSPVSMRNEVKLLINGEEKFPLLLEVLKGAKHHIHFEYYIFEEDVIGREIMEVLKQKARDGIEVRFIYDDFGSGDINRRFLREMRKAGVEVYPFYRIRFLANRLNYRNHRKIVVVDGNKGFVGGINVSDRYINADKYREGTAKQSWPFWRDTHLYVHGLSVHTLQFIFMADWNFCADYDLPITHQYFADIPECKGEALVQIAASGPDSKRSSIMLSNLAAINQSEKSVFITTPYFIPNESIYNAMMEAALAGKDVRLMVPGLSDSKVVNKAAESYFEELLYCGVRIFRYQDGFVHAKSMIVDNNLSIVGTANIDVRSFDLNFEVNAFVYDTQVNQQLTDAFLVDMLHSTELTYAEWSKRSRWNRILEALARLLSPLM